MIKLIVLLTALLALPARAEALLVAAKAAIEAASGWQAVQLVQSGNAQLGILSYASVLATRVKGSGTYS